MREPTVPRHDRAPAMHTCCITMQYLPFAWFFTHIQKGPKALAEYVLYGIMKVLVLFVYEVE